MSSEELLKDALQRTGLPVEYYDYAGSKPTYIVYNEEAEEPTNHGDNKAQNRVIWWQVHLFAPKKSNFRSHKKEIESGLRKAGFFVTDIVPLYEKETDTIHVAISCHMGETEE